MASSQIQTTNFKDDKNWKIFVRQLIICTGAWNCYFLIGLAIGTPTVMLPQLRESNITMSEDLASWLPVTIHCSGMPWVIILSILTSAIGRKKSHIVVSFSCLIGFTIMFYSETISLILIGQVFQGSCVASYLTSAVTILTEFTSPKFRGMFLTFKSATFFWGILVANTIGTFFNWKNIAIVGVLCSIYNLVSVFFWTESPYWLAGKGKFDESSKSHKWLKGTDAESMKELENLLRSYESKRFAKNKINIRTAFQTIFSKKFMKPILLSYLLLCLYCFSGKLVCTVYALVMLKNITNDNWTAYKGMLILDCVTVASMYIGCFLSKKLPRRTMLLSFSSVAVMFLVSLSGYLYIIKLSFVEEVFYVSITLLAGYSISISCGPMIMSTSIIGELLPLDFKSFYMCIIAFSFKAVSSTFLKISPFTFKHLLMHGTFFLYAILSVISLVLIYFFMPETKNKTLQEIEENLTNQGSKSSKESRKLMNNKNVETVE